MLPRPSVHTEVGLQNGAGYAEFAILRGIDPEATGAPITDVVRQIREGRLALRETTSGFPPLLLGRALADRFNLQPGDVVTVISLAGGQPNPVTGISRRSCAS